MRRTREKRGDSAGTSKGGSIERRSKGETDGKRKRKDSEEAEEERERGTLGILGSFVPADDEVALLLSLNTTRGS